MARKPLPPKSASATQAEVLRSVYERIQSILEHSRAQVARTVNTEMVRAYWLIGREIVEEELRGHSRAGYGDELIAQLSARLGAEFGRGFTPSNLRYMRLFYLAYPRLVGQEIHHAVRDELSEETGKRARSPARRGTETTGTLNPNLSWTHYRLLTKVESPNARAFYEIEAVRNHWSSRELDRQINSLLFERLAKSRDRKHDPAPHSRTPLIGVLNAFRRHRQGHASAGRGETLLPRCSTPSGVIVRDTHLGPPPPPDRQVLNAFRRHRQGHVGPLFLTLGQIECSTPSGVIVRDTRSSPAARCTRPGAQRLPASSSGTPVELVGFVAALKVLNAFRRHRQGHNTASLSAQYSLCAQRLPASSSGTPVPHYLHPTYWAACSTPSGVIVRDTRGAVADPGGEPVLNAFRRHRQGHTSCRCPAWAISACSTPSGVIVRDTRPAGEVADAVVEVLNAFRRHRQGHAASFGSGRWPFCAQRLPASSSGTRGLADPLESRVQAVLNAFRRHRQGHPGHPDDPLRRLMCSTPSGVIVRDTGRGERPGRAPEVLNAFRRHRQGHVAARRSGPSPG